MFSFTTPDFVKSPKTRSHSRIDVSPVCSLTAANASLIDVYFTSPICATAPTTPNVAGSVVGFAVA